MSVSLQQALAIVCWKLSAKSIGYSFVEFPQTVGGRYTAVTAVGLLPMAVAGIDIRALVKGQPIWQLS